MKNLFIVSICVTFLIIGCSKEPAPYTQDAMAKLNQAAAKVAQPVPKPGMTKEEGVKMIYEMYKEVYSKAGFDLDKSIIQLENDWKKDPKYAAPQLYQTLTLTVTFQLMQIRKDKTLDIAKVVPKDVINAIDSIVVIKEKEAEQEKLEKIAQAKKKSFAKISGRYEKYRGRTGSIDGAIDVQSISEDFIKFNLSLVRSTTSWDEKRNAVKTVKETLCNFENKTAKLLFDENKLFHYAVYEENGERIVIKFDSMGAYLDVTDQTQCGKCDPKGTYSKSHA